MIRLLLGRCQTHAWKPFCWKCSVTFQTFYWSRVFETTAICFSNFYFLKSFLSGKRSDAQSRMRWWLCDATITRSSGRSGTQSRRQWGGHARGRSKEWKAIMVQFPKYKRQERAIPLLEAIYQSNLYNFSLSEKRAVNTKYILSDAINRETLREEF